MIIPEPPALKRAEHVTPSLYETLLGCPARAAWHIGGRRNTLAPHPLALLGTCFHAVMEGVQRGEVRGDGEERRRAARDLFDRIASDLHGGTHALLRVKFAAPDKLPFYNLFRERAAALAVDYPAGFNQGAAASAQGPRAPVEQRFSSSDGVIVGRPDVIDRQSSEVIDYKSGLATEGAWRVSEKEARRLHLYVYLAREAGMDISRGTIVRGDGQTATIDIAPAAAEAEAQKARDALAAFNADIRDRSFYGLAQPAAETCRMCPCLPMCEPFWEASDQTWEADCGVHVEGTVVEVDAASLQGVPLISLRVNATRGTVGEGEVELEQVPLAWATADGDRAPKVGDVVRLVDGRLANPHDPIIVRADRTTTSLWRVGP